MKLAELEQSLLRAARESLSPSVDDRQRHESALLARLDAAAMSGALPRGDARGAFGAGVASGSVASRIVAKVSPHVVRGRVELVAIGLAAGVVLGGVVGFVLGRGLNGSTAAHRAELSPHINKEAVAGDVVEGAGEPAGVSAEKIVSAEQVGEVMAAEKEAAEQKLAEQGVPAPALVAASSEAAEVLDFDVVPAASHASAAPAARDKRSHHLAAGKPESSLAIELAMLQRARRALGADNGRLALGIVQELDERFPKGVLIEERRATRVLSLCLLGRTPEARRNGREFLARHADSVYAERVRASCAVDGR